MWAIFRGREFDLFNKERKGGPFPWILGCIGFFIALWIGSLVVNRSRNSLSDERKAAEALQNEKKARAESKSFEIRHTISEHLAQFKDLKLRLFPNRTDAIQTGDELVTVIAKRENLRSIKCFLGKEAVFLGDSQWPYLEMGLELPAGIRLKTQLTPSQLDIPKTLGWRGCVLGRVMSSAR